MPEYSVTISLHTTSSLPKDYATNTWSIRADDVSALEVAVAEIEDFYGSITGSFSNNVVQNGHTATCYNRADPEPRAPVFEETWNLPSAPADPPLPHEVAICLSFQGTKSSGIPQARNRGRVYLGPLCTTTMDNDARVATAYANSIATAAENLLTASTAAGAWDWVVWSTVMQTSGEVANGWVDNAFDTQRRRGRETTARTVWP